MPRPRFRVTYETISPESAEHGDAAEHGYCTPRGWQFPIDYLPDGTLTIGGAPASPEEYAELDLDLKEAIGITGSGLEDSGSWLSTVDGDQDYRTGEETRYSLHPPDTITAASYRRLKRALGVR